MGDFGGVPDSERNVIKHGRVAHFSYLPSGAPGRVFVRRAMRGGVLGALLGGLYLDPNRPTQEIRAAIAALRSGVHVPEPLAVRRTRINGGFYRFTLVSREIPEAADLLTLAPKLSQPERRRLLDRVADEMRRLHEAGIYHADLTLKNILASGPSVYIVDLDKAYLKGRRLPAFDVMNLSRLNRSFEKLLGRKGCVTRSEKLRFLRRYLAGSRSVKDVARLCTSGLWAHRLWWSLSGQT